MDSFYKSPYYLLKRKIITDHLDKFPESGSLTIARIIYRDFPEYFNNIDSVRSAIRAYRGSMGDRRRKYLTNKKYVKIQPS